MRLHAKLAPYSARPCCSHRGRALHLVRRIALGQRLHSPRGFEGTALRPGLRVLYMSGYTNGAISQHGVLGEAVMLREKPFTRDKLAWTVREALDGPTAK